MCTDLENGYARHMLALPSAELSSTPDYLGPNLDDHYFATYLQQIVNIQ